MDLIWIWLGLGWSPGGVFDLDHHLAFFRGVEGGSASVNQGIT